MPRKVLIVTKDRVEFNLYHPVALALEKAGSEVIVVAEGLSMDMWVRSGRQIYQGLPKLGDFVPNTMTRTDISPIHVLSTLEPSLVMTGLANPIHLGVFFGEEANRAGIPLGFVEDLWGVHRRSSATPNFICTTDGFGNDLIRKSVMDGRYKTPVIVSVTGSPAMDALQHVVPDPQTKLILEGIEAKRIVLIGGQDESTTPLVQGLLEASQHDAGWVIIPRFHPKWMTDESKKSFRDDWTRLIYKMEARHRVLWTPPPPVLETKTLIPLATEVVSIYSNCLIEAVALGAIPVSWTSEIGKQKMKESMGVEQFPAVGLGACLEVSDADEFLGLPRPGHLRDYMSRAKRALGLDGHATERVVEAILGYLQ